MGIKTDNMFDGCNELVGAVAFEASKLNGNMANGQTGYFMPRYTDGNGKVTYFEKNENNQIVLNLYNANPFVVSGIQYRQGYLHAREYALSTGVRSASSFHYRRNEC